MEGGHLTPLPLSKEVIIRIFFTSLCLILLFLCTVANAKIVFSFKDTDNLSGIYVMDDDGSNTTLLTDTLSPRSPRWAPDGKQIVFERRVKLNDSQKVHLFIMNADGTNIRELTEPIQPDGRDLHASFSPDGKYIVFRRYERIDNDNKKHSICVMDIESGKVKKISDLGVNTPAWSPDGKQIVFTTIPVAGMSGGNVWIMGDNGRNARDLLPPPPEDGLIISRWNPRWSPDGKQILYTEDRDKLDLIDGVLHYIPQGYYYFIYDLRSKQSKRLTSQTI